MLLMLVLMGCGSAMSTLVVDISRTADLNALLALVDLHVCCLQVILAGAAALRALVVVCLGLWRRVSGS
jgi:hypothetical protein